MSTDHSVPMRPIQEAVKAREEEILDALHADRRAGHQHITCPYAGHDDTA